MKVEHKTIGAHHKAASILLADAVGSGVEWAKSFPMRDNFAGARRSCALALSLALALGASGVSADDALAIERHNLAYCYLVLTRSEFGGLRSGEDDPGSAAVLMERLGQRTGMTEAAIAEAILPPVAVEIRADMEARGKPHFSPTACAGHAHYLKTQ